MFSTRCRRLSVASVGLLALASAGTSLVASASAAISHTVTTGTSYAWVGASGGSGGNGQTWTDPLNWLPAGVPGDLDSVAIAGTGETCQAQVQGLPDETSLAHLSLQQDSGCQASIAGGSLVIVGSFAWAYGTLGTETTLAPGSHTTVTGSALGNVVAGTLLVRGSFVLDGASVTVVDPNGLVVGAGGHLQGGLGVIGSLINAAGTVTAGTKVPAGPRLRITGDYTQRRAGTLQFHLPGAFDALSVGGSITIHGRVIYHTTHYYSAPPYETRQLVVTSNDGLVWHPSCERTTGVFHQDGYWHTNSGYDAFPPGYYAKVRFASGPAPPC